jgi:hypothetical protein
MLKIIASLRRLFAVDRMYEVLGAVMNNAVAKIYIPALKRQLRDEKKPQRRASILGLIEEFKPYADPHTQQGKEFAEVAARVVGFTAKKYYTSNVNPEDAVQQMAGDFYDVPRMKGAIQRFKPEDGPLKLRNYWANVLNLHSEYVFRELERKSLQKHKVIMPEEESGEAPGSDDSYRNIAEPEKRDTEEFLTDMIEYVHKNAHRVADEAYRGDLAIEIFDIFIRIANRRNNMEVEPETVKSEWEKKRDREGKSSSRTLYYEGWNTMKETIRKFMQENSKYNRAAGATMIERVAKAAFRARLAKWILGE